MLIVRWLASKGNPLPSALQHVQVPLAQLAWSLGLGSYQYDHDTQLCLLGGHLDAVPVSLAEGSEAVVG